MAVYSSGRRFYSKIRLTPGGKGRRTYQLAAGLDEAGAQLRDALLAELGAQLVAHDQDVERVVDPILAKLALAEGPEVERIERYIRTRLLPGKRRAVEEAPTVRQFGEWWTSGELARRFPGQVTLCKSSKVDARILAMHIYPHLGDVLISAVKVEHLEAVLRGFPPSLATSSRRQMLSRLHRLLDLAVYPAKYLDHNPMPRGFKPRAGRRAFPFLYPEEEARLLARRSIPLYRRIAYGLAARLGLRIGEVFGLRWEDVDLVHGVLRLGEHKTAEHTGARVVPVDEATLRVLVWWHKASGGEGRVIGVGTSSGDQIRADLVRVGALRRELHETTKSARAFSFHGLRRTFVTLSLGVGRTEDWVMRRTGHTSSAMLNRYRISASNAAELRLGWLHPFDESIPEIADRVGGESCPETTEFPEENCRSSDSFWKPPPSDTREEDSKNGPNKGVASRGLALSDHRGQGADRLRRVSDTPRVSDLRPSRLLTRRAA